MFSDYSITCKQVTKIGRDAVLYVESLIESIMGGLEGLINILDSDGGFGALEAQVLFFSHCMKELITSIFYRTKTLRYNSFFRSKLLLI